MARFTPAHGLPYRRELAIRVSGWYWWKAGAVRERRLGEVEDPLPAHHPGIR